MLTDKVREERDGEGRKDVMRDRERNSTKKGIILKYTGQNERGRCSSQQQLNEQHDGSEARSSCLVACSYSCVSDNTNEYAYMCAQMTCYIESHKNEWYLPAAAPQIEDPFTMFSVCEGLRAGNFRTESHKSEWYPPAAAPQIGGPILALPSASKSAPPPCACKEKPQGLINPAMNLRACCTSSGSLAPLPCTGEK